MLCRAIRKASPSWASLGSTDRGAAFLPSPSTLSADAASSPLWPTEPHYGQRASVPAPFGAAATLMRSFATNALRYSEHGPPSEVLRLEHIGLPRMGPSDVLVEFLAAPINPVDINIIEGKYPLKPTLPAIAGVEGVAVVRDAGAEVQSLAPGDTVVPLEAGLGTWSLTAVLPAEALFRIPDTIPTMAAAALTINPPTAVCLLERFVELQEGDVVIQNGANSAAGKAVVEVASSRGIQTINVIRDRPNWSEVEKHMRSLGATVVTTLQEALEMSKHLPRPSLALNCVGGEAATKIAKMLRPGGTMVTYGAMARQPVSVPPSLLIFKDLRLRGFALSMNSTRESKAALLKQVVPLAEKGLFCSSSFREFRLQDFQEALAFCEESYRDAKAFLTMR